MDLDVYPHTSLASQDAPTCHQLLHNDINNWSFSSDRLLLDHLKGFTNRLNDRSISIFNKIQNLDEESNTLGIQVENLWNRFEQLSFNQFIQQQVDDRFDDHTRTDPRKKNHQSYVDLHHPNEDKNFRKEEIQVQDDELFKQALNIFSQYMDFQQVSTDNNQSSFISSHGDTPNFHLTDDLSRSTKTFGSSLSNDSQGTFSPLLVKFKKDLDPWPPLPYLIGSSQFSQDSWPVFDKGKEEEEQFISEIESQRMRHTISRDNINIEKFQSMALVEESPKLQNIDSDQSSASSSLISANGSERIAEIPGSSQGATLLESTMSTASQLPKPFFRSLNSKLKLDVDFAVHLSQALAIHHIPSSTLPTLSAASSQADPSSIGSSSLPSPPKLDSLGPTYLVQSNDEETSSLSQVRECSMVYNQNERYEKASPILSNSLDLSNTKREMPSNSLLEDLISSSDEEDHWMNNLSLTLHSSSFSAVTINGTSSNAFEDELDNSSSSGLTNPKSSDLSHSSSKSYINASNSSLSIKDSEESTFLSFNKRSSQSTWSGNEKVEAPDVMTASSKSSGLNFEKSKMLPSSSENTSLPTLVLDHEDEFEDKLESSSRHDCRKSLFDDSSDEEFWDKIASSLPSSTTTNKQDSKKHSQDKDDKDNMDLFEDFSFPLFSQASDKIATDPTNSTFSDTKRQEPNKELSMQHDTSRKMDFEQVEYLQASNAVMTYVESKSDHHNDPSISSQSSLISQLDKSIATSETKQLEIDQMPDLALSPARISPLTENTSPLGSVEKITSRAMILQDPFGDDDDLWKTQKQVDASNQFQPFNLLPRISDPNSNHYPIEDEKPTSGQLAKDLIQVGQSQHRICLTSTSITSSSQAFTSPQEKSSIATNNDDFDPPTKNQLSLSSSHVPNSHNRIPLKKNIWDDDDDDSFWQSFSSKPSTSATINTATTDVINDDPSGIQELIDNIQVYNQLSLSRNFKDTLPNYRRPPTRRMN